MRHLPNYTTHSYTIQDNDYAWVFEKFGVHEDSVRICCEMAMNKLDKSIDEITVRLRLESIGVGFHSYLLNPAAQARSGFAGISMPLFVDGENKALPPIKYWAPKPDPEMTKRINDNLAFMFYTGEKLNPLPSDEWIVATDSQ